MDKRILNKIAKDWCKSILLSNDGFAFQEAEEDGILTTDETEYILKKSDEIANRITKDDALGSLDDIIKKYYTVEL